jgi:hypothetical protein
MKCVVYVLAAGLITTGCRSPGVKQSTDAGPVWPDVPGMSPGIASVASTTNTPHPINTPHQDLIVTPAATSKGKVMRVNESARFAVLNFPIGTLPAMGQRLDVYRHGLKVGEVKVTGPQQDDNTVADITNGEAQEGDELRAK